MLDQTEDVKMTQREAKEGKSSKWTAIPRLIRSNESKQIRNYRIAAETKSRAMELESKREYIMEMMNDPEVLRRLSLQDDSRTQIALQEFMGDMMETFQEINDRNRSDSFKKLRGIIKKTINCDHCEAKPPKPKKTVYFSEENIYHEIPRKRRKKFDVVVGKCTYYCCFGFLFPV